ncbi:MAG: DUF2849 domain-containing protein [Xanthobacteraceae bacterium]
MTSPLQQKLKITGPVVITANRLADGAVVYRAADGSWTMAIGEAAIATTAPAASALLVAATADDGLVVGPYVAPVETDADGRTQPGNLRERIRVAGPTFDLPVAVGA